MNVVVAFADYILSSYFAPIFPDRVGHLQSNPKNIFERENLQLRQSFRVFGMLHGLKFSVSKNFVAFVRLNFRRVV